MSCQVLPPWSPGSPGLAAPSPACRAPPLPALGPALLGRRSQKAFKPLGAWKDLPAVAVFITERMLPEQEMLVDGDGRKRIQGGFLSREDENDTSYLPDFCVTAKQFIKAPSIPGHEQISRASLASDTSLRKPSSEEWKMLPFWNFASAAVGNVWLILSRFCLGGEGKPPLCGAD